MDSPIPSNLPPPMPPVRVYSVDEIGAKAGLPTSLPMPLSGHQVEQERQQYVEGVRNDLYRTGIEGPYPAPHEKADGVPWLLLAVLALMTAYAVGQRNAEVRMDAMLEPLEVRVATAEAWNVNLRAKIAAAEGNVQQKIDAYAMLEAQRIVEAQP